MAVLVATGAAALSGCADDPSSPENASPASASPESRYLDTLNDHGIRLRASWTETGYRDDYSSVQYGRSICDLVRRQGPSYDPIPLMQLNDKDLSEESVRIVYNAAREIFCPDVAPYEPTATPRATPNTIPGEGNFRVGSSDVQPGTYISQPAVAGQVCVWSRSTDSSGSADAVIDQGVEGGLVRVTIESTDVAFSSSGCQDWQRLSG